MIDHELACTQIFRLKILEKYPKTSDGENGLIKALEESAETKHVAEYFITDWIRNKPRCPMPCDIYQSLDSPGKMKKSDIKSYPRIPDGEDVPPPEYHCNLCEDTGWKQVTLNKEIPDLPGQYYTGVKRCEHPERSVGKLGRK